MWSQHSLDRFVRSDGQAIFRDRLNRHWFASFDKMGPFPNAENAKMYVDQQVPLAPQYTPNNRAEILTHSGEYFQFLDPYDTRGMDLHSIAHALALTNRFGGHTRLPYSVAEHSVRVSRICDPADALWGLLHDAPEAFLNDIVRPAKQVLPDYQALEISVMWKIARFYELDGDEVPPSVHRADLIMCATESRDLLHPTAYKDWNLPHNPLPQSITYPWHWIEARARFIARYMDLKEKA